MTNETLRSVRDLLPGIAEQAQVVDETRRVSDDVIEDLQNTGVLRMLQPKRYGGLEIDPVEFYEVVRAISGACGSTGWIVSVLGVHPWHLALFDQRAQEDVWGRNRLELVSSAYAPMGQLLPVEGGYELSGTWKFSSGCDHASWALLGALQFGAEGRPVDFMTVLVPRADYTIHDVWDVVGMRGTASNEITVTKAFVPEHRTIRNYETAQLRGPGQKINPGPLYRLPFATIFTSAVAAPIVGVVAGCHESYVSVMRERVGSVSAADDSPKTTSPRCRWPAPHPRSTLRHCRWIATSARCGTSRAPGRICRCGCDCGLAAIRCAPPSGRSRRSTCCSRPRGAIR